MQLSDACGSLILTHILGPVPAAPFSPGPGCVCILKQDGEDATWEDTVPKKKLAKLDSKERKRQQVIHELLQTEQAYLRDLIVMKNLFRTFSIAR